MVIFCFCNHPVSCRIHHKVYPFLTGCLLLGINFFQVMSSLYLPVLALRPPPIKLYNCPLVFQSKIFVKFDIMIIITAPPDIFLVIYISSCEALYQTNFKTILVEKMFYTSPSVLCVHCVPTNHITSRQNYCVWLVQIFSSKQIFLLPLVPTGFTGTRFSVEVSLPDCLSNLLGQAKLQTSLIGHVT